MFLKRIQVPDFRILKNVDITFEPEFIPRIFPLGSLNGGGKSTLLQLIFILLSCSSDSEKHIFIQNLLEGFEIEEGESQKLIASISLFDPDDNQNINLDFFYHRDELLIETNGIETEGEEIEKRKLNFSMLNLKKKINAEINEIKQQLESDEEKYIKLKKIQGYKDIGMRRKAIEQEIKNIKYGSLGGLIRNLFSIRIKDINTINTDTIKTIGMDLKALENELILRQENAEFQLTQKEKQSIEAKKFSDLILDYLKNKKTTYICNCIKNNDQQEKYVLLCKSDNLSVDEIGEVFKQISTKVFLAAPFTQVFLFLPKEKTRLLFKNHNNNDSYYSSLEESKRKLSNLFTYELLSIDYVIGFLKAARDKDFKQAIETGEYGNSYQSLLRALNSILGDKKINIDTDLSGVNFKIERDGKTKELYPEDLSHGELKRLSIYVWLKYKEIEDCIVLIDEIENAFHPDWQYQIISDLAEWGKSNQYILATHSYELCQALTPAHVKELEPKLLTDN